MSDNQNPVRDTHDDELCDNPETLCVDCLSYGKDA